MVMMTGAAAAQTENWSAATSSNWFVGANWSGGIPTSAANANLDLILPFPTVIANAAAQARDLHIGRASVGALTLHEQGSLTTRQAYIANYFGSMGSVAVDGSGTVWTGTDYLAVGLSGTGSLAITNGGQVDLRFSDIGRNSSGIGVVNVSGTGSLWANSLGLRIGYLGAANLTIADGGRLTSAYGLVGDRVGSNGAVTVTGAGSNWIDSRDIYVGNRGTGSLRIEDGGSVQSNRSMWIADESSSSGSVVVTGAGSRLTSNNSLNVGGQGTGALAVENGGAVDADIVSIAGPGASGTAVVTGAYSRMTANSSMYVGQAGAGSLEVLNGATVDGSISDAFVGFNATATGDVRIRGTGSTWSSGRDIVIGSSGRGTATVTEGGSIAANAGAGTIHIARHADSEGTLAIGAASGDPATAAGTVSAGSAVFSAVGPGTGRIVFNHTDQNYNFSPAISGAGTIRVEAGRTALTGDNSGFTGATDVTGGTLVVNNLLRGTLGVSQSGRVEGRGTLGPATIASGGTIAPGNSIGTLTIDGDATFAPGSRYEVEVDPAGTASDLIAVSGRAILNGGSVIHVGDAGTYRPRATYRILSATGGVEGRFDEVRSDFAFLDPSLSYGANDVDLTLERNDIVFAAVATTDNQKSAATALDGLTFGDPVYDAVVVLDEPQARSAFDQLSGEIHASAQSALMGASDAMRGVVEQRLRGTLGGGRPASPIAAYASLNAKEHPAGAAAVDIWGRAFGAWGRVRGDGNAAAMVHDEGGLLVGADREVADLLGLPQIVSSMRLGVFGGYSRSHHAIAGRSSTGESANTHLGLHGGAELGDLRLSGGASVTWHNARTERSVAFPGLSETLRASYRARTVQAFGEAAYRLTAAPFAFEPFASLAYVYLARDRYRESGGVAALEVSGSRQGTGFSTIGLRAFAEFELGGRALSVRGMLGWRHAYHHTRTSALVALAGAAPVLIAGAPLERNAMVMEAGIDVPIAGNAMLSLSYDGRHGPRSSEHGLGARVKGSF